MIYDVSHHGATILNGEGSYERKERNIVYSIISSAECKTIVNYVTKIDSKAFINVLKTEQITGNFYQVPHE